MTAELVPVDVADEAGRAARLVDAFVAGRKSFNTREAYRRDLGVWLYWGRVVAGVDPFAARPAHVLVWLGWLEDQGDAGGTRARRLAAVSSWYRWLVREGVVPGNPADLDPAERPKFRAAGTAGLALSAQQASALLREADAAGPRTAALTALYLFTGCRVSELLELDEDSVTMDRGQPALTIRGKGDKHRLAPIVAPAFERLDAYRRTVPAAELLPAIAAGARQARPLFATSTGRRLDRVYVYRLLRRLAVAAGLPELSPHDLRRSHITIALDAGVPLYDVQRGAGHASATQTAAYDRSYLDTTRHAAYRLAALVETGPATGNDGQHSVDSTP